MKPTSTALPLFACALALTFTGSAVAVEEVVSFKCSLAIDAAIKEMDAQSGNLVIRDALEAIDENNGQFVCIPADDSVIFVRLQSTQMSTQDNRLVFTVDTRSYKVLKTFFGR